MKTLLLVSIVAFATSCCPPPKTYPVPESSRQCIIINVEYQWLSETDSRKVIYWKCVEVPRD